MDTFLQVKTTIILSITFVASFDLTMVAALFGLEGVVENPHGESVIVDQEMVYVLEGKRYLNANSLVNVNFHFLVVVLCVIWFSTVLLLYGVSRNSIYCIWFYMFMFMTQMTSLIVWLAIEFFKSNNSVNINLALKIFYLPEVFPWTVMILFVRYLQKIYKLTEAKKDTKQD